MKKIFILIIFIASFIGCNESQITLNQDQIELIYSDTLETNCNYFTIHISESNKEYLTVPCSSSKNEIQIIVNEYKLLSDTLAMLIEVNSTESMHPYNIPLTIQSKSFINKEVYYCKSKDNLTFKKENNNTETLAFFMEKEYRKGYNNDLDSIYLRDSVLIPFCPFVENEYLYIDKAGFYLLMEIINN